MGMRSSKYGISGGALSLTVGALLAAFGTHTALAAPIGSLQDLMNLNPNGIDIGNYKFYDFTYAGLPPAGSPGQAPLASEITVSLPDSVQTIGLQFSADWQSSGGISQESTISYFVHSLSADPLKFVSAVTVSFDGSALLPGIHTAAYETDTLKDINGNVIDTLQLQDDGMSNMIDFSKSLAINPSLQDVQVIKDLLVTSDTNGISGISVSDNTFVTPVGQSPEPASIGLFAVAGMGLLRRRRA